MCLGGLWVDMYVVLRKRDVGSGGLIRGVVEGILVGRKDELRMMGRGEQGRAGKETLKVAEVEVEGRKEGGCAGRSGGGSGKGNERRLMKMMLQDWDRYSLRK